MRSAFNILGNDEMDQIVYRLLEGPLWGWKHASVTLANGNRIWSSIPLTV